MSNEAPQKPAGRRWPLWIAIAVAVAGAAILLDPTHTLKGWLRGEPFYEGRPGSYWRKAIVSQDPAEQSKAEQAIRAGRAAAAPLLAEMLRGPAGNDWSAAQVRWKSAELLGAIGPPARPHAELALIDALDDEDPHVRKVVAQAIESVGVEDPRCVPRLIEMLDGPHSVAAARTLARFGPQAREAVPALIRLLDHEVVEVRWNAARTLGKIRMPALAAVPHLIEQLKDPATPVREHAAEALGDIGPEAKAGIPALIAALGDEDTRVRRDAARALGFMGPEARQAIPQIEKLLQDPAEMVREAAATALRSIDPQREPPP